MSIRYMSNTHVLHMQYNTIHLVGFSNLNDDLYRKGCADTQSCDCGYIIEDSKHFFLICPLYNNPNRYMLNEVQMHSKGRITPQLLLNGNHCLNEGESCTLLQMRVNSLMNLNVLGNKLSICSSN